MCNIYCSFYFVFFSGIEHTERYVFGIRVWGVGPRIILGHFGDHLWTTKNPQNNVRSLLHVLTTNIICWCAAWERIWVFVRPGTNLF